MARQATDRLPVLDGWRAVSILCVLAAHLLPLGPKSMDLNGSVGVLGMAIFFTLSGFLIVSQLLESPEVASFLVRRVSRVVPLAWLYLVVCGLLFGFHIGFLRTALFVANWPPMSFEPFTGHLWSLCIEMQFYLAIALVAILLKRHWWIILPITCVVVAVLRIRDGALASINTYYRVDEILAGGILALIYRGSLRTKAELAAQRIPFLAALLMLLAACHTASRELNYCRPYLAALTVGLTIMNGRDTYRVRILLCRPVWKYWAGISYALYVWHPLYLHTWLGAGDTAIRYLKRPLLLAAVIGTAHLSTHHFERFWIRLGRRATVWLDRRRALAGQA